MLKPLDVQRILSGRILVLGAFLLLPFLSSTTAQTTSPPATTKGEYATVNNTFYIQGGSLAIDNTQPTRGMFSLDLTVPWNDQSPPWTTLPSTGSGVAPLAWQQSMAPSGDKSQLVIWNAEGYQITNYKLSNHSWGAPQNYSSSNPNWGGFHGVIPPTAPGVLGVLHMPNGCWSNTNLSASALCMYNLDTLAWTQSPMPAGYLPTDISYYTFVYSNLRKSMVMYGGTGVLQHAPSPYLLEYLPATTSWNLLQTQAKGTLPGAIYFHCMVESTDYSKMIMFGGAIGTAPVNVIGSLFILDLATLTWTQGADAPQAEARVGHACAVNGDSFVVWGGSNLQSMMSNTPLIYNIRLNQWVHDFVVSGALPTASTSTGSRPSGGSGAQPSGVPNTGQPTTEKSSSGSGGIIGGVVGGVAVLAAVGFFFYRRSKKHQPVSTLTKVDEDRRSREYTSRQDGSSHPTGGKSQWIPLHESDKALPMQPSNFNNNGGPPLTPATPQQPFQSPMQPSYFSNNKHDGSPLTSMQAPAIPLQPFQSPMQPPYFSNNDQHDGSPLTYMQQQAVPPAIPPQPFQSPTTTPPSPYFDNSPYQADGSSYQTYQASTSYQGSPKANSVHAGTLLTSTSTSASPYPGSSPQVNNVHAGTLLTSTTASPPKLSPRSATNPQAIIGSYGSAPQALPTMNLRNPQELDTGSMAMSGPTVVSQSSSSSGGHAPYFPPPPPPASLPLSNLVSPSSSRGMSETVVTANSDVMDKKLALMKAQYEFEVSQIRLEQESLAERQRQG